MRNEGQKSFNFNIDIFFRYAGIGIIPIGKIQLYSKFHIQYLDLPIITI